MATFVLVHGSFFGAWCWDELRQHLSMRGHRTVAPDLPGHGDDATPIDRVTLNDYVEAVVRTARTQETPILVGHGMGAPIAGAAESLPDGIAALVFVAGLLPPEGTPARLMVDQLDPAYVAQAVWAPDERSVSMSPEGVRDFVCSASPTHVDEVVRRMRPEPIAPHEVPVVTTDANFGRTRRYYIETLRDRVMPLELQRSIQKAVTFRRVFALDTDHVPFFSAPARLASCLDAVAADL